MSSSSPSPPDPLEKRCVSTISEYTPSFSQLKSSEPWSVALSSALSTRPVWCTSRSRKSLTASRMLDSRSLISLTSVSRNSSKPTDTNLVRPARLPLFSISAAIHTRSGTSVRSRPSPSQSISTCPSDFRNFSQLIALLTVLTPSAASPSPSAPPEDDGEPAGFSRMMVS